jgi:hypothetical protein
MLPEHRLSFVTDETGSVVTLHSDLSGSDQLLRELLGELRRLPVEPNQPSNPTQHYF